MDLLIAKLVGAMLLPPVNIILMMLLGLWWRKRHPRLATTLLSGAVALLVALSMPLVADGLCRQVETYPPLAPQRVAGLQADAIVVLAGGWRRAAEYGGATVNVFSLERLSYGVWLHHRSGLPIALSGGRVSGDEELAEAEMMQRVLKDEFGLAPRWLETVSRNTAENAREMVALLQQAGVGRIVLVTHAFHMPRAVSEFEAQGIDVIPAPMGFLAGTKFRFRGNHLFPGPKAFLRSYLALHELLGRGWYRLRYGK